MKSILKDIILEFHQSDLPAIIPRGNPIPQLPKDVRKAFVFIGMRRVGKTYFMFQDMQHKLNQGLNKKKYYTSILKTTDSPDFKQKISR